MVEDGAAGGADAFALVGNEHRAAILRALLAAHADADAAYPAPFAALRERAGVDVSSQFAYHLDELVGSMVARTGDGYRLRYAGWKAAAALAAGTYADQPAFGPTAADGACPHCDAAELHASYGDAWLAVACHGCERVLARYPFPPGAASARRRADGLSGLLDAFDRRVRSHFALAVDGVCPECAGRTTRRLEAVDPDAPAPTATRGDGHGVVAVADCGQCGNHLTVPVGFAALADPDIRARYRRQGHAVDDRPFWRVPALVAADVVAPADGASPADGAPRAVTVALPRDDAAAASLAVTVTDDLAVADSPAADDATDR